MNASPTTVDELQGAIRSAASLTISGGASKIPPPDEVTRLDMGQLAGIVDYAPDECVVTVRAGTRLRDIESALDGHGQYLPFDPPFRAAGATIGGTVAMGLSGPGRLRYGGVRDFLIGARVIDGEGRAIQSGGKVVKNAAGFLLHHALVGSLGTLGALAELTFKVFPKPPANVTFRCRHHTLAAAQATIDRLVRSRIEIECLDFDLAGMLWLRLPCRRTGIGARIDRVRRLFGDEAVEVLDEAADASVWSDAREFTWCPAETSLIKIPMTPSALSSLALLECEPARIRFSSGGFVAWIAWSDGIGHLSATLRQLSRPALVVRGPGAGTRLGTATVSEFASRVQRVLDPVHRFRAASTPAR